MTRDAFNSGDLHPSADPETCQVLSWRPPFTEDARINDHDEDTSHCIIPQGQDKRKACPEWIPKIEMRGGLATGSVKVGLVTGTLRDCPWTHAAAVPVDIGHTTQTLAAGIARTSYR
jgi:hypothetical protein